MLGDQQLELAQHLRVTPESKLGLNQLFPPANAQLLQPRDLKLREALVRELRQRRPAPQRQRLIKQRRGAAETAPSHLPPRLAHQPLEHKRIDALSIDPQLIPMLPGHDDPTSLLSSLLERLSKTRDMHLQSFGGAPGRTVPPQLVDQPL